MVNVTDLVQSDVALPVSPACEVGPKRRLIRMNEVESLTGLKKSHVYGLIRLGSFPQRVVLSRRCVAFLEHEVLAWLDARVAERGQA